MKTHPHFLLEISFNESTGEPVAAYLQVRKGEIAETKEVEAGTAFADYDSTGMFIGIELLGPCPVEVLDQIIQGEPESIRRFVRGVAPQHFLQSLIKV